MCMIMFLFCYVIPLPVVNLNPFSTTLPIFFVYIQYFIQCVVYPVFLFLHYYVTFYKLYLAIQLYLQECLSPVHTERVERIERVDAVGVNASYL